MVMDQKSGNEGIREEGNRAKKNTLRPVCRPPLVPSFIHSLILFLFAILFCPLGTAHADQVSIPATKDNTLIEPGSLGNINSNGAGDGIYSGRVGSFGEGVRLRAVVAFDVAGYVPAGATITSAALRLTLVQAHSGVQVHTLYRLLQDWGEGTSNGAGQGDAASPGDATWLHTFFPDSFWSNPGGDFTATVSATQNVDPLGVYTWSSAQLTTDVQQWLDQPASNFGWILIGNEADLTTAKKFASREEGIEADEPALLIDYTTCPVITQQPANARLCAGATSTSFSIIATGVGTLAYQWQIETSPNVWQGLGNDPFPLPCGGGAFAYATPINSPSVTIGVNPCAGVSVYHVRCVVSNACGQGDTNSNPASLSFCTADINCDGQVNVSDLLLVINHWGQCPAPPAACPADIAPTGGNGVVDVSDLLRVINGWGACP